MKNHLNFILLEKKAKTNIYRVISAEDGSTLGHVLWHCPWRQYVFEPNIEYLTIWSCGCLEELTEFIKKIKAQLGVKK